MELKGKKRLSSISDLWKNKVGHMPFEPQALNAHAHHAGVNNWAGKSYCLFKKHIKY